MNRRQFAKSSALTLAVAGLGGPAFTAPSCGPSKEKAVRVAGFVIELSKEALPLLDLLGAHDLASEVSAKVIPALEKLKGVLAEVNIPDAQSALQTVRAALSSVATGLLNLPESARRTTIIGILASINVLLLTVEAFVESEVPGSVKPAAVSASVSVSVTDSKIMKAFEASRP